VFDVQNNSAGGSYTARDRVGAAYGMAEYPISSKVRVIGGARVENWRLDLETSPIFDEPGFARPRNTDVLPSLIVNIKLSENQSVRMAVARTLSRPEYRELSPITFRDVIGEQAVTGNPNLKRALVDNFDVRWEAYHGTGALLSVALFAKRFHDPIERVDIATSGASQLGFVNADGASNYGVELEIREGLGTLAPALENFAIFANSTLMRSEIRTGNDSISALTNSKRAMVGQSPYVLNVGASYAAPGGAGATLMYNVVGKRITSAGTMPLPDTYEMPRNVLDFSAQMPLKSRLSVKVAAKNLLDAAYERRQGDVTRLSYKSGRVYSAGFSYKL
jgi:TonB-dependent receptor